MSCFADVNVSQGSVATYARCGGILNIHLTTNLPRNLQVKKMFNWFTFDVSYGYEFVASHFWSTMYMPDKVTDIKSSNSAPHWRHQLWGTGARAPLELGHVKKIGSFYVGSGSSRS